jgi:hypothetical protein
MVIADEKGHGFTILEKSGTNGVKITPGSNLPTGKIGIIPYYQIFRARRERIISQEIYNIACHAQGTEANLIFLFYIVKYCLLRYRESLLEHENFQLSKLSCSDSIRNDTFTTERVFSRYITLKGQVEESWIKAPYRVIESIGIAPQGIKILSNLDSPASLSTDNDSWVTVEED